MHSSNDKKHTIQDLTSALHGSLDLQTFFQRLAKIVQSTLPTNGIVLYSLDNRNSLICPMANIIYGRFTRLFSKINYPPEIQNQTDLSPGSITLEDDFYAREILNCCLSIARTVPISTLCIPLHTELVPDMYITFFSFGKRRYNEEHHAFASTLSTILRTALHNIFTYEKVLADRDSLASENTRLQQPDDHEVDEFLSGANSGLREVMELVFQVAQTDTPVLILGETGVGKELVANAIHRMSAQRDGPLIKVNCGAIPESLVDSMLFGHEKGAFTGANSMQKGFFERAHNGIIFLDEVGELPLMAQTKLLRVLQFREIERVGGTRPIKLNLRVIAATHRVMRDMVREKTFREDLWFRLNVFPIHIPPLRERTEDIPELAQHFIARKCQEMNIRDLPSMSKQSLARMLEYSWPGNVRELENLIERSLILNRHKAVLECELPDASRDECCPQKCEAARIHARATAEISAPPFYTLEEYNARYIKNILTYTKGKIHGPQGAAAILGINPSTLRSRLEKLHINSRNYRWQDGE